MRLLKMSLIAAFAFFAVASCNQSGTSGPASPEPPASQETPAAPATPDEVAEGESIYKNTCIKCHKEDGTGGEVEIRGQTLNAANFTSAKMKKEPDSAYLEYITKGVPSEGMPSFKDRLSEDQMKAVVKYIRKNFQ